MEKKINDDLKSETPSLNKKRKREKTKDDIQEESNSPNKKKKVEINNCLTFPNISHDKLYDKLSSKINSFSMHKIFTTSSKNKYNYICQELTSDINSLQINDAKILNLENKTLLFLLSSNKLYIYEIAENKYYELIKEIPLDSQNSFTFSYSPTDLFFITPNKKNPRKNKIQDNNNNINTKIRTRMLLSMCIASCKEKYLCEFDLKKLIFKKIKNILPKKGLAQYLINNDMKYKLYQNNKILTYNNNCAYIQKLYGAPKFKNLKQKNIESVSILNKNIFSICTSDIVYIFDANSEAILGDFKTLSRGKKAKLIKPDNNLLLVYSNTDIALYDLESLMFFQKLELNDIINNTSEEIKKAKQLNNNNIAILFDSIFVVYNLEKNCITFKWLYNNINNNINANRILMEISPNIVLVNNNNQKFHLINSIKGDEIASFSYNNTYFSLSKKIKRYNFKYGVTRDENIEEDRNNISKNFVLINNSNNTFILNSTLEE